MTRVAGSDDSQLGGRALVWQQVCQNMFPAINVKAVKLAACKRVVLLDYDADSQVMMILGCCLMG